MVAFSVRLLTAVRTERAPGRKARGTTIRIAWSAPPSVTRGLADLAAHSGDWRHGRRAAEIAIELLNDLGQSARAVLIVVAGSGGRWHQQALGAEHRFRMAADQVSHDLDQTGLLPAGTSAFQNSL